MAGLDGSPQLLSILAAWDAVRFMALGGEQLDLCDGLACDATIRAAWAYCFRRQFGEWRYRNKIAYPNDALPCLVVRDEEQDAAANSVEHEVERSPRWLLTNGGGKDTLASLMILDGSAASHDLNEGYLPVGGSKQHQQELLRQVRDVAASAAVDTMMVAVTDDFDRPDDHFARAEVEAKRFKTDFAVGHAANYLGYFPVVL